MKTLLVFVLTSAAFGAAGGHWVVTWGAAPAPQLPAESQMRSAGLEYSNQTLREVVHISLGGDSFRVRLSNAYGKDTVRIEAVHLALRADGPAIAPGSDRPLTFSGRPAVSIPPDAEVLSDPVELKAPSGADLAVTLFLREAAAGAGIHYSAQQTSYVGDGDLSGAASIPDAHPITSWVFLTGVDVLAPRKAFAVIAFGDSITDGARSTVNANQRWPDILANRLRQGKSEIAVADEGIGGNRILHDASGNVRFGVSALARFDRDVLAQPGVRYVIVLEGINDLGHAGTSAPESETVSTEDLIAGLRQMIERAHERGIRILGATLTPFEGTAFPGYFTPLKEAKRKALNEWIRSGGAFDGVVDFDKAVRDANHPDRMRSDYDGGDHLHPGDAGYRAMGQAVNLGLLK